MSEALALNLVLWLPAAGMLMVLLLPAGRDSLVRALSFALLLLVFVLAAWLYVRFDAAAPGLQFATRHPWIAPWGVDYHVGLDGYNLLLVLLTGFLGPLVVASSTSAITRQVRLFHGLVFFIQFAMLGAFVAQDLLLFYVFWEAMLIPMFLIIGIWGGERRIYAAFKLFLYTAFGSILMLGAILYLAWSQQAAQGVMSFAFADLFRVPLSASQQNWLFAAFALAFAIKVPVAPLHTWLPDAHVEAPTAGSVILAGVLLKMGTYGFMRLGFPLFPQATASFTPLVMSLAVFGIVYGACLALVQTDIKKVVAYSSISHLGYVMLGLISLDLISVQGAILQMVSHGLVAGGLFMMIGMIYERCHSRALADYGGLARLLPVFSVFFTLLMLASIGLPGTSGFAGEFLVLMGAFSAAWAQWQLGVAWPLWLAAGAVSGVVLGAWYMLWLTQRFLFGEPRAPQADAPPADLGWRERAVLTALVAAILAIGLYPQEPMSKTELAARDFQTLVQRNATRPAAP